MDVNRITYKVLIWDSKQKVNSGTNELRNICRILECHEPKLNVLYNLKHIKELLCNLQTSEWKNNVLSKPKLRHREIMYDKISLNSPNFTLLDTENKFIYVMSCNDKSVLDFVDIAWSRRTTLLYN